MIDPEIYNLPNPKGCYCSVEFYVSTHKMMFVKVSNPEAVEKHHSYSYLAFETVIFHSGPFHWQGIDFIIGSPEERRALISQILPKLDPSILDPFAEKYHLVKIQRSTYEVILVAANIHKVEKIPDVRFYFDGVDA